MKRKYLKQNNKPNKKELNKFSLLKNIIKNIERNYFFLYLISGLNMYTKMKMKIIWLIINHPSNLNQEIV